MIINPILPIWLMAIISVALLVPMRKGIYNYIRQVVIVLILFAINLRPMVPNGEVTEVKRDYKVLFVVDNTISMLAEDAGTGKERRIDVAKNDISYVMNCLEGASYSVIKFDNEARQMVPFSTDMGIVNQAIKSLNGQSQYYATGTSLAILREPLVTILSQFEDDNIYLFLITDGENTKEEDILPLNLAAKYIKGGAVLGYGTEKGGYMKAQNFVGDTEAPSYVRFFNYDTYTDEKAVSKIDEKNLKKMASELGINYIHMGRTENIDPLLNAINNEVSKLEMEEVTKKTGYGDIYYFLAIPLVILLIFDFIYYKRRVWKAAK